MAKKYLDDCGGFKPIAIPKPKKKAATQTTKKSNTGKTAKKK